MATQIVLKSGESIRDGVLFAGLPGIGLVGKIAADYILKELKSKKIADVYSDSFPPSVYTHRGVINLIQDELYLVEHKKRKFVFLVGPVQPVLNPTSTASEEHYEFARAIVNAAKKMGISEVYTLAGVNIGDKRLEIEPGVIVSATDKSVLDEFKKAGAKPGIEGGLISGAAGLILGETKKRGMKGACIMGETNARLIYGDHGAAKKVIELLVKKFGFKIKMTGIAKEAKNIEKAFVQLNRQLQQKKEASQRESDSHDLSYVR